MSIGGKVVDFIRGVFSRNVEAKKEAGGGIDLSGMALDMFGDVSVQAVMHGTMDDYISMSQALMGRFIDYERMDDYPDCSTALNVLADDATVSDPQEHHVMWTVCRDESIVSMLNHVLQKKIMVDDEAWETIRILCKYGNAFEEVLVNEGGVQGLNYLPTPTMRRIEGDRGEIKGFIQSFRGAFEVQPYILGNLEFDLGVGRDPQTGVAMFEPWRIVHMRLRHTRRKAMYGVGMLEPARWVWKRLVLLEDAALISRLSRAPSRFAFYVDVGKLPTERAEKYLDLIRQKMKKRKFVNPRSGQLDLRYSPLATDEDFYLPVRDSREVVRADVLNTPQWTGMEDVEYFRGKLHAAMMVPKAYLGYTDDMPSRATLSQTDVRFARTVLRVQREYRNNLKAVTDIHLASQRIDPAYVDYNLAMTIPSAIFELAQLEVQNTRAQLAVGLDPFVSKHWILSKLFSLSDGEIERIMAERKIEGAAAAEAQGGGGGGRFEAREPERRGHLFVEPKPVRGMYDLEHDLFRGGNPSSERRAEDKLNQILQENRGLAAQLNQTQSFMQELRQAVRAQGRSSL